MRKYSNPATVSAWRQQQDRCASCGKRGPIEVHHMLGGRVARPDREWNFLALCQACHEKYGHGRENLSYCLWWKMRSDPENYDRAAMQAWLKRFGTETLPRARKP